ncbi:carbohydrate kinase family protein [Jannaschia sp. LMIT008]|uniref:carbohydrate kinase family protein n=1 Tax=Jannaschia maritima TaxID=3032585 RepID=UPI002811E2B4|nr:carbohydrate kinase family protein [Jannaschia sp. LMIT008]
MDGRDGDGAVLCVGRVYADLIFTGLPRPPEAGREVFADGLTVAAGGGAAITAAWLAALGRRTLLAAHLPAAPFDAAVTRDLIAAGVDLSPCRPATGSEPQVTVALPLDGDRAFVTRAPGPAIPPLDADALRRAGVRHLHVGELRTLTDHPALLDLARDLGASLSADCAWDDAPDPGFADLVPRLDLFFPNAAEVAHLAARGLDRWPAVTAVKRGADGAELRRGGTILARPAPALHAVDATGAGDAFDAGFLDRWLAGGTDAACLEAGIACGARAVTRAGGMPLPGPVPA